MSESDRIVFDETISQQPYDASIWAHKYWAYVNDNSGSGGSYSSGQCQIDTSSLANSQDMVNWSEAYTTNPCIMSVYAQDSVTSTLYANFANAIYFMGMKSGSWNIYDSYTAQFNDRTVCQSVPYSNFYWNYVVNSTWSNDAVKKFGNLYMYAGLDVPNCVQYSTTVAAAGVGECENSDYNVTPTLINTTSFNYGVGYNSAFLTRQLQTCYTANTTFSTTATSNQVWKNYFTCASCVAGNANAIGIWYMNLIVPLKVISPDGFFSKVGSCKNSYLNMTINLNQCSHVLTSTPTSGNIVANSNLTASNITLYGSAQTCPYMVASALANNGANANIGGGFLYSNGINITTSFSFGKQINQTVAGALVNPFNNNVRLYVPLYRPNAVYEAQILTNRLYTFQYDSIFQYTISNIAAAGSFSNIICSKPNLKKLVIIPQLAQAVNGPVSNTFKTCVSPYSSAPASCAPLGGVGLYNILVNVGGINTTQQAIQYGFDMFTQELTQMGLLGGQDLMAASGQIDKNSWDMLYSYYVFDLSRIVAESGADPSVTRTVSIQATNNSAIACDYYCFVVNSDTYTLDRIGGRTSQA